jgi:DNA-binding transcriptional LysR family regulator
MKAIRVGSVRRVLCASPRYLESHGSPENLAELSRHAIISSTAIGRSSEWRFGHGSELAVARIRPRLTVNTNDAVLQAALDGFGITRLLSYQVAAAVASGQLAILLVDREPPPMPIHILHREGRHASAKIRCFVDLMASRLREDPALN